jgi:NAD(P)H dehydrogenase (quinone)
MTKIVIVYDSRTGNTEKMASAVGEGAKQVAGTEVVLRKADEATLDDLLNADGIIMGSPTYYGQMSGKLKAFIDETVKIHGKLNGKAGGAFTSSGGTACGAETTLLSILGTMLVHGMIVQGNPRNKHYGAASVGAPKKEEVEVCRELGERIATLAGKVKA